MGIQNYRIFSVHIFILLVCGKIAFGFQELQKRTMQLRAHEMF